MRQKSHARTSRRTKTNSSRANGSRRSHGSQSILTSGAFSSLSGMPSSGFHGDGSAVTASSRQMTSSQSSGRGKSSAYVQKRALSTESRTLSTFPQTLSSASALPEAPLVSSSTRSSTTSKSEPSVPSLRSSVPSGNSVRTTSSTALANHKLFLDRLGQSPLSSFSDLGIGAMGGSTLLVDAGNDTATKKTRVAMDTIKRISTAIALSIKTATTEGSIAVSANGGDDGSSTGGNSSRTKSRRFFGASPSGMFGDSFTDNANDLDNSKAQELSRDADENSVGGGSGGGGVGFGGGFSLLALLSALGLLDSLMALFDLLMGTSSTALTDDG